MPRSAREKSESGIYHIIIRGINRQAIFEDEEDCFQYLNTIQRIGNFFHDRFKSEPVKDDLYFQTVLRYIHQNPYNR